MLPDKKLYFLNLFVTYTALDYIFSYMENRWIWHEKYYPDNHTPWEQPGMVGA
jgi:hypothetical protein